MVEALLEHPGISVNSGRLVCWQVMRAGGDTALGRLGGSAFSVHRRYIPITSEPSVLYRRTVNESLVKLCILLIYW